MKRLWFVLCMAGLIFAGGCAGGGILDRASAETVNTRAALVDYTEQCLKEGQEEIAFVTGELTEEDIQSVNLSQEGYYGVCSRYEITEVGLLQKTYVTLYCELSDNYYAENAIKNGMEIPESRETAAELAAVCEEILAELALEDAGAYTREKKIHDYLVRHVEYGYPDEDRSEDSDAFSSYGALVRGKAVCNGYAQAMKLLLRLAGVPCRIIAGTADGEEHAWNLVKLKGEWYHVDATWDDPLPDVEGRVLYSYFNLDDGRMETDHVWDASIYPEAEGVSLNYYTKNGLAFADIDALEDGAAALLSGEQPEHLEVQVGDYDADVYTKENVQFLFRYTDASSVNWITAGKAPYTTLYFTFYY